MLVQTQLLFVSACKEKLNKHLYERGKKCLRAEAKVMLTIRQHMLRNKALKHVKTVCGRLV